MMSAFRNIFSALASTCFLVFLFGCDESVNPIVGEEQPFTIWGFMDSNADTQRVRVFSIEDRLGTDRAGPIDAEVTSTDLYTGERRQWKDEEVTFYDGSVGHVFWSDFQAECESSYRLEVVRSDGATSSVEVTTPPAVDVQFDFSSRSTNVPIHIEGYPPQFIKVEMVWDVITVPPKNVYPRSNQAPISYSYPVFISYADKLKPVEDGWTLTVDMVEDFSTIQSEFKKVCLLTKYIALRGIVFRFLVAYEEWAPLGGTFDPEVLIQPGAFSNIDNGFGFFGTGYFVRIKWYPGNDVVADVGFAFAGPCTGEPSPLDPDCKMPPEPCFPEGYVPPRF